MGYIDIGAVVDSRGLVNTVSSTSAAARAAAKDAAIAEAKRRAKEQLSAGQVADDGSFIPDMPKAIADAGTGTKFAMVGGIAAVGVGVVWALTRKRRNPSPRRRRRRARR